MKLHLINLTLLGALSFASLIAGVFFLRFWHLSKDRIFGFFCAAFWLLSLNWLGLAVIDSVRETRHQVFYARLLAFVLIIIGIIDKNRRTSDDA